MLFLLLFTWLTFCHLYISLDFSSSETLPDHFPHPYLGRSCMRSLKDENKSQDSPLGALGPWIRATAMAGDREEKNIDATENNTQINISINYLATVKANHPAPHKQPFICYLHIEFSSITANSLVVWFENSFWHPYHLIFLQKYKSYHFLKGRLNKTYGENISTVPLPC